MLGEDDGTAGLGTAWVDGVIGSRMVWGAQHRGLGEDDVVAGSGTVSRSWGLCLHGRRRHRLESRKMAACKRASTVVGNDGAEDMGRTRRRHRLQGGRRQRGLQENFWRKILAA
jgi:hypothetical protein